jgi:hypothetical protein
MYQFGIQTSMQKELIDKMEELICNANLYQAQDPKAKHDVQQYPLEAYGI